MRSSSTWTRWSTEPSLRVVGRLNGRARVSEQAFQHGGIPGRHRDPASVVVDRHQVTSARIHHRGPRLPADEERTEVVPWGELVDGAVDVAVEGPVGDGAEVERGRTERSE